MSTVTTQSVERLVVLDPDRQVVETADPQRVLVRDSTNRAVVVTAPPLQVTAHGPSGPSGPAGPPGPQGAPGPAGPSGGGTVPEFTATFSTPATSWVFNHGLNTKAVVVLCFQPDGVTTKYGDVSFPSDDVVQVDWYFAEVGVMRILGPERTEV